MAIRLLLILLGGALAAQQLPVSELLQQGAAANQAGQFERAEPLLQKAAALAPDNPQIKLEWAYALSRLHRFQPADAALRGVAAPQEPAQALAYHRLRAAIASGLGKPAEAAGEMRNALSLAPDNAQLLAAAGVSEMQAQDWSAAVAHLREACERQWTPKVAFLLAQAELHAGNVAAALKTALRVQQSADSGAIEQLLGDLSERSGDSVAAAKAYEKAIALEPAEPEHRIAFAIELLQHQTLEPALLTLEAGVKDFPRSARMRTLLGLAYYLADKNAEAVRTLLEAIRQEPGLEAARTYLNEILLQQTAAPEAEEIRVVCAYADAQPRNAKANAACGGLELRALTEQGAAMNREGILRRLRAASRNDAKERSARCQFAKALEAFEHWTEARPEAEACAALDPQSVEAHFRLARIYRHLGMTERAAEQDRLRAQAAEHQNEANEARYRTLTRFLYDGR